ncbi:MAG TPA: alpha/beta hydrolase [Burkholderiales bacterium]|nr:alpha/beta hydrolase [Burkholderiales bacterium]
MRRLAALILVLTLAACTPVFFQPSGSIYSTPGLYGIDYERAEFKAADGTALFAWFMPARGEARATVLYLHGNAENISAHFANVAWMPAAGFNVLALDYRGYGGSEGKPSLAGVQLDIDAAMRTLINRPDVDPDRIIVFGQSLGGALAIHYVAHSAYRDHILAVIADSAFADYRMVAKEKMAGFFITWPLQWLPGFTVDNDYSPRASVAALSPIPLLLMHGDRDSIVPAHHSQLLFEAAQEPKTFWSIPDSGHIQALRSAKVRQRLTEFLVQHSLARLPEAPKRASADYVDVRVR